MSADAVETAAPADFEAEIVRLQNEMFKELKNCGIAKRAGDAEARAAAGDRMYEIELAIRAKMKIQEAALKKLLKPPPKAGHAAKVAQLLDAFRLGAKIMRVWHDVLAEQKRSNRASERTYSVIGVLRSIGADRIALEPLLDDPDIDVRAMAADALIEFLPDRVIPMLEVIAKRHPWSSAGWTASFALMMHSTGMAKQALELTNSKYPLGPRGPD